MSNFDLTLFKMLKGGLVLIWELGMNLVPTLLSNEVIAGLLYV